MTDRQSNAIFVIAAILLIGAVAYRVIPVGVEFVKNKVKDKIDEVFRELQPEPAKKSARPVSLGIPQMRSVQLVQSKQVQLKQNRVIRMKVTAYCLCKICCGKWAEQKDRRTSTGDNAKIYDGVAGDPKLLPYRTRLKIPEIGIKEVDDTGGGMRQSAKSGIYHLDVRMESHEKARKWGVRWLDVEVL